MHIRRLDRENITFEDCLIYSSIVVDGFERDALFNNYLPPSYRLRDDISKPHSAAAQKQREETIQRLIVVNARRVHLWVLAGADVMSILYDDNGDPVATSLWRHPYFSPAKRTLRWFARVGLSVRERWYKLLDLVLLWPTDGFQHPLYNPALEKQLHTADRKCGVSVTMAELDIFFRMSPAELESATTPASQTYLLRTLCVRQSAQAKGYGKELVRYGLADLPIVGPSFQSEKGLITLPPKASVISSPVAKEFYRRQGFTLSASSDETLPSGEVLPYLYMMRKI